MKTLNMGLLQGTLDVALTRRIDVLQRSDELAWATLYQDRFGIVLRKDHPLAERTHIPFTSWGRAVRLSDKSHPQRL
jgi:DNA-binding transcriptional LysR family regulator